MCDWSRRDITLDARIQMWRMAAAALDGCVWLSATGSMVTHDISGVWCGTELGYFEGGVYVSWSLWRAEMCREGGARPLHSFSSPSLKSRLIAGRGTPDSAGGWLRGLKTPLSGSAGCFPSCEGRWKIVSSTRIQRTSDSEKYQGSHTSCPVLQRLHSHRAISSWWNRKRELEKNISTIELSTTLVDFIKFL